MAGAFLAACERANQARVFRYEACAIVNRFYWNHLQSWQLLAAALAPWLSIVAVIGLLNAIGLGWLVQGLGWLLFLLITAPILLMVLGGWWLRRNLIAGPCPACGQPVMVLRGLESACPHCGEPLNSKGHNVQRQSPPGTIDVQAVEVGRRELRDR
jgi:endogenous inhibitor of DNA gyrase (YacG/DUF329 family)